MNNSQRVFINTIAQYTRTIINMVLSLYTVRIVLLALGESDFGIYTLVAGMVSMLAFVTNSLVTTTQRFVSFTQGKEKVEEVKVVFSNSLIIHLVLGLCVVLCMELLTPFLFDKFLNIPQERIQTAAYVYQIVIIMLFLTLITSPFRALLISHENIVYISCVDVLDGVLKVVFATLLTYSSYDNLLLYAIMMMLVQFFNFAVMSGYCYKKYEECIIPNIKLITVGYVKDILSFAGWSIYSTGCIVGRQQGVAIVLNKTMGTLVNAAYGLAFQIAGYTSFLSSALVNAIIPQIVKSEGSGDRVRALRLSAITCKFMFFLLSAICIPCIFEINQLLGLWLKIVPEYASQFCIMVMIASMIDSLTVGLAHINQAIGRIGLYSVVVNTPKLMCLPIIYIGMRLGGGINIVILSYISVELLSSIIRLPFIKRTAGLNIKEFIHSVIIREIFPLGVCITICYCCSQYLSVPYRFVITFVLSFFCYMISIYIVGLTKYERSIIEKLLLQVNSRLFYSKK